MSSRALHDGIGDGLGEYDEQQVARLHWMQVHGQSEPEQKRLRRVVGNYIDGLHRGPFGALRRVARFWALPALHGEPESIASAAVILELSGVALEPGRRVCAVDWQRFER
jgi:hypothetical protein